MFCKRNPGEVCTFFCDVGFSATNASNTGYLNNVQFIPPYSSGSNRIECTSSSTWEKLLSSLCEKNQCPNTIPHGSISTSCSKGYNDYCGYSCYSGFSAFIRSGFSAFESNLRCNSSGQWALPTTSRDVCVRESEFCPADIRNCSFGSKCIGYEGQNCWYSCDTGCRKNPNVFGVTCNNRTWNVDTDLLCTDCQRCSLHIPNGWIISNNTIRNY